MDKREALRWIDNVEDRLKAKVRTAWSPSERREIELRGELEADFYQIWFKLCKLESIRRWVNNYGKLTRSQRNILKEYERSVI
jgi:hypothetical protein